MGQYFNVNRCRTSFDCCKNCRERHVGCHSTCEKYIEAKSKYEKKRDEAYRKYKIENIADDIRIDGIHRMTGKKSK